MPIYDWRDPPHRDPRAIPGDVAQVLDADGRPLFGVFWCDTETGQVGRYVRDVQKGGLQRTPDGLTLLRLWETHPAPLRLVPLGEPEADTPHIIG